MEDVYFSKKIKSILDNLDLMSLGKNVAIKVHFGEKGCDTHISPEVVKAVYEKVLSCGKTASLVECNTLYKGERTTSTNHIKLAKEHGFGFAPIDILDGEYGQDYVEINGCKIGKGIKKYDSMIVLTHFKGHIMAGFGGAIKNIGMGLGSRAGKLYMHANIKPTVNSEVCTGCGICVKNCNENAITIIDGKAYIDHEKCVGCAMCIAVCPNESIEIAWDSHTGEEIQEKTSQYANGVVSAFKKNQIVYVNVLENITTDCDCLGEKQEPIMKDVGILMSKDIVAIDKASLDLVRKHSGDEFDQINLINKDNQIKCAIENNLGSSKYNLIDLD
ncbi:DUF362 domain-containing protein [Candidatus Pacearchaeota archaeon]|nr:DUF362 domain-containing protein [Candidatus Pacearchaeota archaeon]